MVLIVVLVLTISQSLQAQELGVLRAQSLDKVFDGIEAVAQAAGYDLDRQTMLSTALGMIDIESAELLDMSKAVAVVLPAEGMMLQQNGLVAAVPVTDVAAAIALIGEKYTSHTSEEQLHTFATDQGPALYLLEADGYIRFGGSSNLVTSFDPLAGQPPDSAISLEIFLEPVAPMIHAGIEAASQQIRTEMQSDTAAQDVVPINPQAVVSMVDLYLDGARSVVNNTSRIRFALDVKDGYVRFSESLIPKQGSALAQFTASQKAAQLEIARLTDPGSSFFLVGNITLSDELRLGVKEVTHRYMNLMREMFDTSKNEAAATEESEEVAAEDKEAAAQTDSSVGSPTFWMEYLDAMEPYMDRGVDCLRGDFSMSFDFAGKLTFVEAFGLNEQSCHDLYSEMSEHMREVISQNSELASVLSVSDGPELGKSASVLVTMDTMELAKMVDPTSAEETEEVMKAIYGEKMSFAWASFDEWIVVTGGEDSLSLLQEAYSGRNKQAAQPSFKPLGEDLSVLISFNLGRFLSGLQGIIPVGQEELGGLSQALAGETGRIPMGLRFDDQSASFEIAVPLKTIEAIATFAAEQKAKEQAAEPDSTAEDPEG
jgi:hypothetical protein